METIGEALDQKREERKGVTSLVLCKRELFYLPHQGHGPSHSVYPVSKRLAQLEAEHFGVSLYEE